MREPPREERTRGSRPPERAPTPARRVALDVLVRVERAGAFADLALRAALGRSRLAPADRALATELVQGTLRWRGLLDALLARVVDRELASLEPLVRQALRLGAYQIARLDRVPDRAAVDETVRALRAAGGGRASGFANAVLRRLSREWREMELPRLADDPVGHLRDALSLPGWLAHRLVGDLGAEEAALLARALAEVPPLCVRANQRRTTREALLERLRERFPDARPGLARSAIRLGARGDPGRAPELRLGLFTVQDDASQLVVDLLDPQPGERILDACAAPGGKATALAERVGEAGRVMALDRHPRRLALLARDGARLGLANLRLAACDVARGLCLSARVDRVLVDAPCSGIGALRRNPDLRWRLAPDDPARLAALQLAILRAAAMALRPGGALVYSTCTLLREENEAVVDAFLAGEPGFRRTAHGELPAALAPFLDEGGVLRIWPHRHDADGFFAARLERRP